VFFIAAFEAPAVVIGLDDVAVAGQAVEQRGGHLGVGGSVQMGSAGTTPVIVQPNAKNEIIWRFSKAGTFEYACLIPGHREAGMIGKVTVK